MKRISIIIHGKKIGKLFWYLDYDPKVQDQDKFVAKLASAVRPFHGFGYAGFSHRKYLLEKLKNEIFDWDKRSKIAKLKLDEYKAKKIITDNLTLAYNKLPIDKLHVHVFPHFNEFINKHMGGTSGSVIWKNTMILFINPIIGWESHLAGSVLHEYNHSCAFRSHKWDTLLTKMILEGMAEVFLEEIFPNAPYRVGRTLSYEASQKIFTKIKKHLNSKSNKIYNEVFYDDKKYPLWAGYSIGYWIVKKFRNKNQNLSWEQIIKIKPGIILAKSGYKK